MNNNDRVIESLKLPSETSQTSFPSPGLLSFSLQDLLTAELPKLWTLNNMGKLKVTSISTILCKAWSGPTCHSTDLMDQLLCNFTFCCCNKTLTATTWRKVTHPISQLVCHWRKSEKQGHGGMLLLGSSCVYVSGWASSFFLCLFLSVQERKETEGAAENVVCGHWVLVRTTLQDPDFGESA